MPHVTSEQLEAYLSEYGWSYAQETCGSLRTGWQGEDRLFPLIIKLSSTCVSFEVRPLVDLDLDWSQWPELSRDLLELNSQTKLVKLAVSDAGDVSLSCQVLAAGFDFEMLSRILGIIGYYADEITRDILARLERYGYQFAPAMLS
jgi:hypothetical protein